MNDSHRDMFHSEEKENYLKIRMAKNYTYQTTSLLLQCTRHRFTYSSYIKLYIIVIYRL